MISKRAGDIALPGRIDLEPQAIGKAVEDPVLGGASPDRSSIARVAAGKFGTKSALIVTMSIAGWSFMNAPSCGSSTLQGPQVTPQKCTMVGRPACAFSQLLPAAALERLELRLRVRRRRRHQKRQQQRRRK